MKLDTAAGSPLYFRIFQTGLVVPDPRYRGEWKISTASYTYAVYDRPDTAERRAAHPLALGQGQSELA